MRKRSFALILVLIIVLQGCSSENQNQHQHLSAQKGFSTLEKAVNHYKKKVKKHLVLVKTTKGDSILICEDYGYHFYISEIEHSDGRYIPQRLTAILQLNSLKAVPIQFKIKKPHSYDIVLVQANKKGFKPFSKNLSFNIFADPGKHQGYGPSLVKSYKMIK